MYQSIRLLLPLLFFYGWTAQAQPSSNDKYLEHLYLETLYVSGKVIDEQTKQALEYATISLFKTEDKSLVDGMISNEKGLFQLAIQPGHYHVVIEFLAYQKQTIENIIVSKKNGSINLGTIELSPKMANLEEVTVREEKSEMVMTLDKKVFNVGKDLTSQGGSAVDVLDNVPSVQVDGEGQVSLRGNGSVQILVDGKPSILANSPSGLRTLQANMIDRVEVITNPSARYQGDGTAGILNIILKKNEKKDLNGSFDITVGYPGNYGLSFNLNYRTKKLNFFTNYGIRYRKNPSEGSKDQEFYRQDSTFRTSQFSDQIQKKLSNNIRFGADYFFNTKNTLTAAFTYSISNHNDFITTTYNDFISDSYEPFLVSIRAGDEKINEPKLEYSLTYKKTFKEEGQKLTIDMRYQDEIEKETANYTSQFYTSDLLANGSPDVLQRANNKNFSSQSILQVDYVHPFSKNHKLEVGLRNSIRRIDNDYLAEELTDNIWLPFKNFSNRFKYNENISAAYLQYGNKINKFAYSLGFRLEYSLISTQLSENEKVNKRDYLSPIPTLHLTYDLEKNNAIQLSYSRRLRRPRFWDFNPFYSFSGDRNFFEGNPELDPEFSHSIEFGHIKKGEKGSLSSAIYYRHMTGRIERIRRAETDRLFITQPQNLNTEDAFGFEFTTAYTPFKWWRLTNDFNFYRSIIDGTNENETLTTDTYTWFVRGSSKFTIQKKTNIQVRYYYRAPKQIPQGQRLNVYSINIAASRSIFNNKGKLTLSVNDVFNSLRYNYIAEGENFRTESSQQWQSRSILLSLNYRLNNKK